MEKKKISIYEIAAEAGVSPATVSRTINQPERVTAKKREKVLEVIRKYDFKPNVLAKSLKNARSGVIGILSATVDSPFYGRLVSECILAAEEEGYILLVANYRYGQPGDFGMLEKICEQRAESVILLGGSMDSSKMDEGAISVVNYMTESVPVVVMGKSQGIPCYEVRIDESGAMEQAIEYLIRQGHQKIAFWGGEETVYSTMEKRLAYLRLLHKYGIESRAEWLQYGGYGLKKGYAVMREMRREDLPTAVICINDLFACGVMNAAFDRGMRVPQDISVLSFDDTYLARGVRPTLSSVACDYRELAQKLVGTAVRAARGEEADRLQLVKTRLNERDSCQCVNEHREWRRFNNL